MASKKAAYAGVTALVVALVACSASDKPAGEDDGGQPSASGSRDSHGSGGMPSVNGSGGRAGSNTSDGSGGKASVDAGGGASGTGGSTLNDRDSGAAITTEAGAPDGSPICGTAAENDVVTLACPTGQRIDSVTFASFGNPTGACGNFAAGTCNAAVSASLVADLCVGRASCTVPATNGNFGDPCNGTVKSLSVEVQCIPGAPTAEPKPFKGVANSPCAARSALGVSWYYNWEQSETEPCNDGKGGEFVPMIWGHTGAEQTAASITSAVASFVDKGYAYVLGFNEPDNSTQSNIPVNTAITLWPAFDNPAIQVVSPGTQSNQNPGQAWFGDFMMQVNANPDLRADVIALHWYGWNAGSCDAKASGLENYIKWAEAFAGNRPIWITEWGCLNDSASDEDTVLAFYQGALAVFAKHPRIERYAWYPWADNCHLNDDNGALTALGKAYAAAPATR